MTTPPSKNRIVPVSVKLGTQERQRLIALATARKRSPHYLMREAVAEYLGREEAREAFRLEAARSWRDYEESGLHLTHEDVDAWVESLGTGKPGRRRKWRK